MNKATHIKAIQDLLVGTPKLPKAFINDMALLLDTYKAGGKDSAPKIKQTIIVDGITYAWCNKHEVYEVGGNFREGSKGREYQVLCKAAEAELNTTSKLIHDLDKIMLSDDATPESAFEALQGKKKLDVIRKGTYDINNRVKDVKEYDYTFDYIGKAEYE